MSGAASVRPPAAAAAYVAANAAIEGLGRGAGGRTVADPRQHCRSRNHRRASVGSAPGGGSGGRVHLERENNVLGRVGNEDEIAQAVFYLFTNTYTTGSTLYPDGGYALR